MDSWALTRFSSSSNSLSNRSSRCSSSVNSPVALLKEMLRMEERGGFGEGLSVVFVAGGVAVVELF